VASGWLVLGAGEKAIVGSNGKNNSRSPFGMTPKKTDKNNGNDNSKSENAGFFASLRMTVCIFAV
jgi:hypothetical protein